MKTAVYTALAFISFTTVFGQARQFTFEQRQRQLDSLELLQQEAIRDGDKDKFTAEIRQLQAIIKTETENRPQVEASAQNQDSPPKKPKNETNFIEGAYDSFVERPILDKLIIIMGALATVAGIFLLFTRLFLAISSKRKIRTSKKAGKTNKRTPTTMKIPTQNGAPAKAPYVPPAPPAPIPENVIYTIRELASKYPSAEEMAKMRQSKRPAENVEIEIDSYPQEQDEEDFLPIELPPSKHKPQKEPPPSSARITHASGGAQQTDIKRTVIKRFDSGEDVTKIAQDFNLSKDQVAMILKLARRK